MENTVITLSLLNVTSVATSFGPRLELRQTPAATLPLLNAVVKLQMFFLIFTSGGTCSACGIRGSTLNGAE